MRKVDIEYTPAKKLVFMNHNDIKIEVDGEEEVANQGPTPESKLKSPNSSSKFHKNLSTLTIH